MKRKQKPRDVAVRPSPRVGSGWLLLGLLVVAAGAVLAVKTLRSGDAEPAPVASAESRPASSAPAFAPTVANAVAAPSPAPKGMVWIPGGEFSMGSHVESEAFCALPGLTRDALPVHRVYVDGFWMDATEVTNEDFERFVKATGYVTIAERTPTAAEFPGAPPENSGCGLDGVHADRDARPTARSLSMVALSEGRELAAAAWTGQHDLAAENAIPSCRLRTTTPKRMRSGRANGYRPKPSGNSRLAAA